MEIVRIDPDLKAFKSLLRQPLSIGFTAFEDQAIDEDRIAIVNVVERGPGMPGID